MAKCKLIRSSIPAEITFKNLYLAWTNPSPGSTFPSQDITLNTSECPDYDKIRVIGMSGSNYQFSVDITRGYNAHLSANGSNNTSMYRLMARVSDTKYTVGSGYSGSTQMDNVMIPLFIYVYKDNPIAKVNAIASSVKTNAQNCMMPDNVTTVADALADSGWKTLNTYVKYRKIGKIVSIQTTFTAEVITSSSWSTFGTLPVGYRPNVASFVTLYNDRTSLHQMIRVNADGTVQVNGNVTISGYMTYFVD